MPIQTPICDFGQKALPFELKSTDNKIISLDNIKGEKWNSYNVYL
jgi:peroxiredoxin